MALLIFPPQTISYRIHIQPQDLHRSRILARTQVLLYNPQINMCLMDLAWRVWRRDVNAKKRVLVMMESRDDETWADTSE
jgi:hypothetical protein